MQRVSKLPVRQILNGFTRQFASKGGKDSKGCGDKEKDSASKKVDVCAPAKKLDLCAAKKDDKDGESENCGGAPASKEANKEIFACAPAKQLDLCAAKKDGKGEKCGAGDKESLDCVPAKKLDLCGAKKGGKEEKSDKGDSGCAPAKKLDLCGAKKDEKDGEMEKCRGALSADGTVGLDMGGVGRKGSCQAKKQEEFKGSKAASLRKICLFGLLPAVILLNIIILSSRTDEERPEFKPWPHMYKRDKRFPWGDGVKSFFHNPHTNALPEIGYEDDI